MAEESAIPYLREVLVFLGAAVLIVPLFHRLKISPILGYLAVGLLIGPFGLRFVTDVEGVRHLAELGVVFLLFNIGIELSFRRLWEMRRLVFGLGTAQILITGAVIAGIASLWDNSSSVSVVLGAAFALSSTAMVMQLLMERGDIATPHGRVAFSILLMQDIAVVPVLFLVTTLAQPDENLGAALATSLIRSIVVVAVIIVVGRLVVRPIFRLVASTRSSELFIALTLLGILGLSFATSAFGLSAALGAFMAGLLIAETEFRPQVEADIRPFRGLLLGLFFISVGMSINVEAALNNAIWVILSVIGLVLLKGALATSLTLIFGKPIRDAIRSGILLGQAGEFAFIVIGTALTLKLMPEDVAQFMAVVVSLSMAVTPFLPKLADIVSDMLPVADRTDDLTLLESDMEGHVIVAGFGRVGQTVSRLLAAQKVPFVALDTNSDIVRAARQHQQPVYFGNPVQEHVLERVGVDKARAIVITVNDSKASRHMLKRIREQWPKLAVYARSEDLAHSRELMELGASAVVPETEESSLQLGGMVLTAMDFPPDAVAQCLETARGEIYAPSDSAA
jgi:CPA2 family monovalent cation:H+ antiporter-2